MAQYYDDDRFGYDDDDYLQHDGSSVCVIEACAGAKLVVNLCEEYTGDTFLRLFDDNISMLAENDDITDENLGNVSVGALCSKIVYLVPDLVNTSSLAPECSTYYIQQSCRGEGSCSGRTRVAGGIAAPTSLPTSVPTPAPSTPEEFKESVFVYSFRTRLTVQFECEGARCDGLAEMDGSSQEAFREVFAGSMSSVSLDDVSIVSVSLYSSYWPTFRGVFATTSKTGNASGIDAAIAALTAESQASFLDGSMSAQFVNRSVELGSKSVNRSTTVYFGVPETSAHVEKQEVQTYPPSGVPTVAPSGHPSRAPSASPSSDPTRGECDCCCLGFDCC